MEKTWYVDVGVALRAANQNLLIAGGNHTIIPSAICRPPRTDYNLLGWTIPPQCSGVDPTPSSPARGWPRNEYNSFGWMTSPNTTTNVFAFVVTKTNVPRLRPCGPVGGRLPPLHRMRPTLRRFIIRLKTRYVAGGQLPPLRYICFVLPHIQRVYLRFAFVKMWKHGTLPYRRIQTGQRRSPQ